MGSARETMNAQSQRARAQRGSLPAAVQRRARPRCVRCRAAPGKPESPTHAGYSSHPLTSQRTGSLHLGGRGSPKGTQSFLIRDDRDVPPRAAMGLSSSCSGSAAGSRRKRSVLTQLHCLCRPSAYAWVLQRGAPGPGGAASRQPRANPRTHPGAELPVTPRSPRQPQHHV